MRILVLVRVLVLAVALWPVLAPASASACGQQSMTKPLPPPPVWMFRCIPMLPPEVTVRFAPGSARLSAQARARLNDLALSMRLWVIGTGAFGIAGYGDAADGPAQYLALGRERALAVALYLERHGAIASTRLTVYGVHAGFATVIGGAVPGNGPSGVVTIDKTVDFSVDPPPP